MIRLVQPHRSLAPPVQGLCLVHNAAPAILVAISERAFARRVMTQGGLGCCAECYLGLALRGCLSVPRKRGVEVPLSAVPTRVMLSEINLRQRATLLRGKPIKVKRLRHVHLDVLASQVDGAQV